MGTRTKSRRYRTSPERTCVVCRARRGKDDLIRVAKPGDTLVVDPTGKGTGRGVYICRRSACLQSPGLARRLAHGLRTKLSAEDREHLDACIDSLGEDQPDANPIADPPHRTADHHESSRTSTDR